MHYNKFAVAAASLALFAVARADDLELDNDDIPSQCRSLCAPVKSLADICDVDDDRDENMSDRDEDLLQAQCFCTNASFDVAGRTSQCAACMHQNNNDRSDNEDIDDIMRTCGFASASSWDSSAQTTSVNVQATRPTATADLTTTITGAVRTDDSNTTGGGAQPTTTFTTTSTSTSTSSSDDSSSSSTDAPNAAAGLAPMGAMGGIIGFGAYVAAAAVAGGMLFC